MIALEAPELGEFTTVAVLAPGTRLRVNAVTALAGYILIEAAGFDGTPLPGRSFADATPLEGDCFWEPVAWKSTNEIGVRAGEPVVLRFRMKMAKIYGLEFE